MEAIAAIQAAAYATPLVPLSHSQVLDLSVGWVGGSFQAQKLIRRSTSTLLLRHPVELQALHQACKASALVVSPAELSLVTALR